MATVTAPDTNVDQPPCSPFGGAVGERLSAELAALTERVRGGIVEVRNGQGGGTGTVVRPDGLIVTNHHVVPGEGAHVTTPTGAQYPARVVASLPERDLAILKIDATDLPWLPLGDSQALRVGELVVAVGHPLGVTGAATLGIFSGFGPIEGRGGRHFQEALLAAIELRPGNSGGPLVNARGEVVGINAMVLGPHTALAVPSATAQRLIGAASGRRQTLGVQIGVAQLPQALMARHGVEQAEALIVLGVEDDTPAGRAGVLPGDIVLRYNGQPLQEPGDLAWQLTGAAEGVSVTLSLLRGGEPREVVVALS
jgi:serine protease Do